MPVDARRWDAAIPNGSRGAFMEGDGSRAGGPDLTRQALPVPQSGALSHRFGVFVTLTGVPPLVGMM